jgi:lipid A disaccharide synthetase
MDEPLVLELIQADFNETRLKTELQHLLEEKETHRIKSGYHQLRKQLGEGGAAKRCAELMVAYLSY